MAIEAFISQSTNLSEAWGQVMLRLLSYGVSDLSPVVVSVSDFDEDGPIEIPEIRHALDQQLAAHSKASVATVANTIFPMSLWNPVEPNNAVALYARYERIWPRILRVPANRRGVYFRRLTTFRPSAHPDDPPVNQLQRLIDIYRQTHRRSALQAGVFDPTADHRNEPFLGFPCLQQVAFVPLGEDGLGVTAFYAMQYQFEKAYGNYLGLCRLGRFVAAQLDRRLTQMTCTASIVHRSDLTKGALAALGAELNTISAARQEQQTA